jgi:hypothetical protein
MPTILGKTVSAGTVARVIEAYNAGRGEDDQLDGAGVQAAIRQQVINKVKKYEKAKAIAAADHESDFDLA